MMNKYWRSIAIIMVIVLGIGTFYTYKQFQGNNFPEFVLHKQSGDQGELKPVTLQGQYTDDGGNTVDTVNITEKGSTYDRDLSLINMYLKSGHSSKMVEKLQKEHRNFMRGKFNEPGFYEDEKLLVFADIDVDYSNYIHEQDFEFHMSILNKEDNKKNTFKMDVPNAERLDYSYVEDVQVKNNNLYIFTNEDVRGKDDAYNSEVHVYQFDIETNKLLHDEAIVTVSYKESTSLNLRLLSETNMKANHEYVVFQNIETEDSWIGNESEEDIDVRPGELIAYDFATNETKALKLTEEVQNLEDMDMMFDGSTIYFMDVSDKELTVYVYDVKAEKVERQFTADIPEAPSKHTDVSDNDTENISLDGEEGRPILQIKNDKLYMLTSQSISANVMVMDLESGEIVYDGVIKEKDGAESDAAYDLILYNFQLDE